MHLKTILAIAATTMLTTSFEAAYAQQQMQRVQVGTLECRGGASIGFIVGSVTNLGCVLRINGMPEDHYVATIRKIGVDIGITEQTRLAWSVYAPTARLGPGDIAGSYAGVDGSAPSASVLEPMFWSAARTNPSRCSLERRGQCRSQRSCGPGGLELRPGR